LANVDGRKLLTVKDPQGKLLFSGPVETKEDLDKMPADVRERYNRLEQNDLPTVNPRSDTDSADEDDTDDGDDEDDDDDGRLENSIAAGVVSVVSSRDDSSINLILIGSGVFFLRVVSVRCPQRRKLMHARAKSAEDSGRYRR
jgi:hypothetical protein